ncbi:putative amp-dependent synthetase ligase [Golovinomyces cichoracearum]|uniref:Putative amp-dependent synthetase ligase n=1 Tax=Golovinomyces cichoracearum TaxID=62708 RepID=A0A420I7C1_9PEZI|nr:putative amp-dependent synthetase ligase [Golovinomyces cichoracearum]
MDFLLNRLDKLVTGTLSEWDRLSTALFVLSISSFIYFVINTRDPDIHPILLQRQSQASRLRQQGESSIFRSLSVPYDTPLTSGLNIRKPGDSKWINGHDGDLRDIWLKAIAGARNREGVETGAIGKIFTIEGIKNVKEHDLGDLTRQLNLIGQYLKNRELDRVAIYLPNSVEFLATLFACAFHNLTTILLQYDLPPHEILSRLKQSKADTVIVAAGSFPINLVLKDYSTLKQLILVVDEGSRHIDWNDVPAETGSSVNVTAWHEIIQDQEPAAGKDLPTSEKFVKLKNIIAFVASEMVEYTQANVIAGIAGQLTSIPATQTFNPSDLFLPIDCLSSLYPLTLTLSALYSNTSIALTGVASHSPSISLAVHGISPTVIVASSHTMFKFYEETKGTLSSPLFKLIYLLETRDLTSNGVMPIASVFSSMFDRWRPTIGTTPGKLRLIYLSTLTGSENPINSSILSDLRILTRSRIIHALTAPKVAGAVAQTGVYDYRVSPNCSAAHFGPPVSSVEIFFQDKENYDTTDNLTRGELIVAGPAVVGEKASLGVIGMMGADNTLSLL